MARRRPCSTAPCAGSRPWLPRPAGVACRGPSACRSGSQVSRRIIWMGRLPLSERAFSSSWKSKPIDAALGCSHGRSGLVFGSSRSGRSSGRQTMITSQLGSSSSVLSSASYSSTPFCTACSGLSVAMFSRARLSSVRSSRPFQMIVERKPTLVWNPGNGK